MTKLNSSGHIDVSVRKILSLLFYVYAFSVLLSPRISVGSLPSGKSIDVRLDDLIILIACIFFSISILYDRRKLKVESFEILLVLLIFSGLISFIVNWNFGGGSLLYFLKEIELYLAYFAFIAGARYISFRFFTKIIILAAVVNFFYILIQLLSGKYYGLENGYYGIGAVADFSSLSSGFIFGFFVIFFMVLGGGNNYIKSFFFYVSCLLVFSRVSFISFTFVLAIKSIGTIKRFFASALLVVIAMMGVVFLLADNPFILRMTNFDSIFLSLQQRIENYYFPLVDKIDGPLMVFLGSGKGFWGVGGYPIEAHNYYLRILLESGLLGLVIFLGFLLSLLFYLVRVRPFSGYKSDILLLYVIAMAVASFVQDAFSNHKAVSIFIMLLVVVRSDEIKRHFNG